MKLILISVAVLLLLSLGACAGDTQSSGWLDDFNDGYKAGFDSGYKSGFEDGARAGYTHGRNAEYFHLSETFGDWFYDAYPQYR